MVGKTNQLLSLLSNYLFKCTAFIMFIIKTLVLCCFTFIFTHVASLEITDGSDEYM